MKEFWLRHKIHFIFAFIILFSFFIRIYKINKVPVSLFGDELDVGYQAYSILKTGRDYTGHFLPLQFRSFTEYRTPLYLYSAVPTVALFGVNVYGIRLPAVIFGVLGVLGMYLLVKEITKSKTLSLIAALIMAISPWHIHYSRAAFEVTLLLFLLIYGLYFFLQGLDKPLYFIPATLFIVLMPWVYSTAQLYMPLVLVFLVICWFRRIFTMTNRKMLIVLGMIFFTILTPYAWSTFFGGGTERFSTLSIFTNPVMEGTIGELRQEDAIMSLNTAFTPILGRVFHNKYSYVLKAFGVNYLKTFSTQFLFLSGDGNPRHNSSGMGQLYLIELVFLLAGSYFFFKANIDAKKKWLVIYLLFTASIPASLTVDGSNHATRLILMLVPLVIIISYGIYGLYNAVLKKQRKLFIVVVGALYFINFTYYQHFYWIHFPLATEKTWGYGWDQVVKSADDYSKNYKKVVIGSHKAPAFLFYLALDEYPPEKYQKEKDSSLVEVGGFGPSKQIGNIYFPVEDRGYNLYNISSAMDDDMIYVASMEEFNLDLVKEPKRLPLDLSLVKTVSYLSGEPAFYFITKK